MDARDKTQLYMSYMTRIFGTENNNHKWKFVSSTLSKETTSSNIIIIHQETYFGKLLNDGDTWYISIDQAKYILL
jgi:hypothetical protein